MSVTAAQLKKLFPSAKAELVSAVIASWPYAETAGITTKQRIALFFANVGVETGGLRLIVESLNYTSAARIRAVWPTRFRTDEAAQPFVRQPQKLANKVYNGRMGNRTGSNDGWMFRGSGMMQTTGRENYTALGFGDNPDALRDPAVAFSTAVREWAKRGCNAMADRGDVKACRKAINGGTIGLAEVEALYAKALTVFAYEQPGTTPKPDATRVSAAKGLMTTPPPKSLIEKVQQLLRERGYPEVGNVDGRMGARTRNAILAFQADNSLDLTGEISDALLSDLIKAPQRTVSPERAEATAATLKDAPSIQQGQALTKGGIGAAVLATAGGVVNGSISVDDVVGHISTGKMIWAALGAAAPYLALAAGGVIVAIYGVRFVREQVQAYREGRHV